MPNLSSTPSGRSQGIRRRAGTHLVRLLALDCICAIAVLVLFALLHHALPQRLNVTTSRATDAATKAVMAGGNKAYAVARFSLPDAAAAGASLQTKNRYESNDVQVTLSTVTVGNSVCHVQDIHIACVENLQTAFAEGSYGKGIRSHPLTMAKENRAICAINGDYYGTSAETGAVIRNGVLYRDAPNNDVLVLYRNGVMRIVAAEAFNGENELQSGAYQTWCFGPSLLSKDGTSLTSFQTDKRIGRSNPRTAIGYYAPGHYCFLTVDGRSEDSGGMTLSELSAFCESLGLALAYNLDGGRTSIMTFGDSVVNKPSEGGRKSSDIIYICETEEDL